jgi:hypothetical protein
MRVQEGRTDSDASQIPSTMPIPIPARRPTDNDSQRGPTLDDTRKRRIALRREWVPTSTNNPPQSVGQPSDRQAVEATTVMDSEPTAAELDVGTSLYDCMVAARQRRKLREAEKVATSSTSTGQDPTQGTTAAPTK